MPLPVPFTLGSYEVLAQIGEGGMGEVYKALDLKLGRHVALKVLPPHMARDAERMARFKREAQLLASLNHPNIAAIYGIEESNGVLALVMELVEGPTLAERLIPGAIPVSEALPIARQIAEAVEAAHEKAIIHRDLKPANIKVTPEGRVKVLDFGLAKILQQAPPPPSDPDLSPTMSLSATRAGVIMGTAAYMSPEQARAQTVDKRADIWAFGVVFLEMLTGRRLFTGETVSDTLAAVLKTEMDWQSLPPETPVAIRRLLRRCLERDSKRRIPDLVVVRMELDEPPAEPAPAAPPAPIPKGKSALPWILAAAVSAVAAMALAIVHFREQTTQAEPLRLEFSMPYNTRFLGHVVISPNGRMVAFLAGGAQGRAQLWVRSLDSLQSRPLPGTANAGYMFWSPDSRHIAFWAAGKLQRIDVTGGPPVTICETANVALGGTWLPNGWIILGGLSGGLSRVSASGGALTPVTRVNPDRGEFQHTWPAVLRDGKHFLYHANSNRPDVSGIYLAPIDSDFKVGDARLIVKTSVSARYSPAMGPASGALLFVRGASLVAQRFDETRLELTGEIATIAENVGQYRSRPIFDVSASGVIVYSAGHGMQAAPGWIDRQGNRSAITIRPAMFRTLALSPQQTQIAFQLLQEEGRRMWNLWLLDTASGLSTRFTFQDSGTPVWSPDGRTVAFSSAQGILTKASNGSGEPELVFESRIGTLLYLNDWSPDGRTLLYCTRSSNKSVDLFLLPLDQDRRPKPYLISEFNETQGQFSPDGKWVAYTSNESDDYEVYVQSIPPGKGKWKISSEGGTMGARQENDMK